MSEPTPIDSNFDTEAEQTIYEESSKIFKKIENNLFQTFRILQMQVLTAKSALQKISVKKGDQADFAQDTLTKMEKIK